MKICALTSSPTHFQQGLFSNVGALLPCAMETVSAAPVNGLVGGGVLPPPPTPPSQPPSPFSPTSAKQQLTSGPQPPQHKGGGVTDDMRGGGNHQEEDRGVDLSFDINVKKENFEGPEGLEIKPTQGGIKVKTECDLKIKNEFRSDNNHQSSTSVKSGSLAGGRLQIFKEGRMLLELCHREGDKVNWVATTKKVYWPPTGPASHTARLDSNASTHTATGSDGSLETGSVHSSHPSLSPWGQTHSPRPSPSYQPRPSPSPSPWQPGPPHRVKAVPRKLTNPPPGLVFGMKPPQGVRNYRKKIRPFKRKCRNGSEIKVGLFILKLECNAATKWVKKGTRRIVDPERRAARLNNAIIRITNLKNKIHVPIQAWKTGRTDLNHLVKGGPTLSAPSSPSNVGFRVKSELKMVTETCTASVTCVTASPRFTSKVKAETRTVTAETKTVPVRTMPITPTVARVKQEALPSDRLKSATVTSLMSPEMQRVRMEIGPQNPLLGPGRDERDGNFLSPRKRGQLREFENGSPSAKNRRLSSEHRLSTDSLGSTSDRSSPYRAPHSPHRGAPLSPSHGGGASPRPSAKVSNFSIDSIMGGSSKPVTPTKSFNPIRPQVPVAPTPTRPSPTPVKSPPPASPFTPFPGYPGVHPLLQTDPRLSLLDPRVAQLAQLSQLSQLSQLTQLTDPRLAHLAGLPDPRLSQMAQDPRLNSLADPRLTPGAVYPFPFNPYAAFSHAASVSSATVTSQSPASVWTPPVASASSPTPTIPPPRAFASSPQSPAQPPPNPASSREQHFESTSRVNESRPSPVPSSAHRPRDTHTLPPDPGFRGPPKVKSESRSMDVDDVPLNLCMKPTSL